MNEGYEQAQSTGEFVSKSQRKRESQELQALGAELTKLSDDQLIDMVLPGKLFEAVKQAKSIRQHGAIKRQLKYIGGILRTIETDSIREALARLAMQSAHAVHEHHKIERWRDRLIDQGDIALGELLSEAPYLDRQKLRQLCRNARSERGQEKSVNASRALYRYLRECLE